MQFYSYWKVNGANPKTGEGSQEVRISSYTVILTAVTAGKHASVPGDAPGPLPNTSFIPTHLIFTTPFLQLRTQRNWKIEWTRNGVGVWMQAVWLQDDNKKKKSDTHAKCRPEDKRATIQKLGAIQQRRIEGWATKLHKAQEFPLALSSDHSASPKLRHKILWAAPHTRSWGLWKEGSLLGVGAALVSWQKNIMSCGGQCVACTPPHTHT